MSRAIWLWIGCLSWCCSALAADTRGQVVRVADGDTLTVVDASGQHIKVRLAGIDAPELRQPHGKAARQALKFMVDGKRVIVQSRKHDRYRRSVGKVMLDNRDINLAMVSLGYAWHYKKYAKEQSVSDRDAYARAELQAKERRLAMWGNPDPVPPWEWRRLR